MDSTGGDVSVDIKEDVTASGDDDTTGISVSNAGKDKEDTVTVKVGRDVSATANTHGATGIKDYTNSKGETKVEVGNDVKATSNEYASGVYVSSYGTSDTTVGGNIIADAKKLNATGVYASANNGGKAVVTAGGIIEAVSEGNSATGIRTNAYASQDNRGSVEIEAASVIADSYSDARGIEISSVQDSDVKITVKGFVNSEDSFHDDAIGIESNLEGTPTADITVTGNLSTTGTAVYIENEAQSKTNLEIDGEIFAERNIVLAGETNIENLNITIWKADTAKGQNVVENQDGSEYSRNEKAEKQINYIIKAEDNIALSGTGTKTASGYYTEHQDKKVYLKVDIPSGSRAEFYDINGNKNYEIIPDGEGGAYLVVPRGGGVQVGVKLIAIESESVENKEAGSKDAGNSYNGGGTSDSGSSDSSDSSDSGSDNTNKTNTMDGFGGVPAATQAVWSMQVHTLSHAGTDLNLNVVDVLKPVDTLTAINNFGASGAPNMGTNNIKGTGMVSFNNLFADSVTDTVEVPVTAEVYNGQTYTVMYSDGTSIQIPCIMDGVLSIPFNKNAEGLTYIIYGIQLNPAMFIGMQPATGF